MNDLVSLILRSLRSYLGRIWPKALHAAMRQVVSIHRAAEKSGVLGNPPLAPVLLARVLPDRTPCIGPDPPA